MRGLAHGEARIETRTYATKILSRTQARKKSLRNHEGKACKTTRVFFADIRNQPLRPGTHYRRDTLFALRDIFASRSRLEVAAANA
jgi:hypothetical protein